MNFFLVRHEHAEGIILQNKHKKTPSKTFEIALQYILFYKDIIGHDACTKCNTRSESDSPCSDSHRISDDNDIFVITPKRKIITSFKLMLESLKCNIFEKQWNVKWFIEA